MQASSSPSPGFALESLASQPNGREDRCGPTRDSRRHMSTLAGTDVTLANFIGGQFRPGRGEKLDPVVDPATGKVIAEVTGANAEDVDAAVGAAAGAFASWAATTPGERSAALLALADRIEEHVDELVALEE